MSPLNQNLASAFPDVLKVTVHSQAGHAAPIFPATITLTNHVYEVIWTCHDLASGERLQIRFPGREPEGPFLTVEAREQVPGEVIGYGNRGPAETLKEYDYEVRAVRNAGSRKVADGHLINNSLTSVNDPRVDGVDPLPDPPGPGGLKKI